MTMKSASGPQSLLFTLPTCSAPAGVVRFDAKCAGTSDLLGESPMSKRAQPRRQTHGKPKKREPKGAKTADGKLIQGLMVATSTKGSYKDFVVIMGNRMIEWKGTMDVVLLPGAPVDSPTALVHKRCLHEFIGDASLKYWSPKTGRVPPAGRVS